MYYCISSRHYTFFLSKCPQETWEQFHIRSHCIQRSIDTYPEGIHHIDELTRMSFLWVAQNFMWCRYPASIEKRLHLLFSCSGIHGAAATSVGNPKKIHQHATYHPARPARPARSAHPAIATNPNPACYPASFAHHDVRSYNAEPDPSSANPPGSTEAKRGVFFVSV